RRRARVYTPSNLCKSHSDPGEDYMRNIFGTLLLLAAASTAQEFRATISGRVTDAQESVVPSVRISVVQIGTEAKFETVSDHEGLYTIPFLPPATYRLTAELAGFKRYVRDGLAAGANERLGIDIQMEVGAVSETISVQAEASV